MIRALYPGTFDPIHNGHIDIATRAAALFDELIIGVYDTPPKTLLLDTSQRILLCRQCLGHLPNVQVRAYTGLTVDFAHTVGASVSSRLAPSDFEHEFQIR
jgi:pantetheine-phosphate adenylyltransferase